MHVRPSSKYWLPDAVLQGVGVFRNSPVCIREVQWPNQPSLGRLTSACSLIIPSFDWLLLQQDVRSARFIPISLCLVSVILWVSKGSMGSRMESGLLFNCDSSTQPSSVGTGKTKGSRKISF